MPFLRTDTCLRATHRQARIINFFKSEGFSNFYRKGLDFLKQSRGKNAWGLEIGDKGLKAAKASFHDGVLHVETVDRIDYATVSQEPTSKKPELIENALKIFLKHNQIEKSDRIIVSLSGRMILSRFFSLPPIKKSHVTEAINYELRKQIPFEPSEIMWDYQKFEDPAAPKRGIKIGLFATKKENIYGLLPSFEPIKMNLEAIQITPIAIYNLVQLSSTSDEDVIVVNVEKENTDFIVAGKSKFWNRSIPITEVNIALTREIQRSIGYYISLSKGSKPEKIFLMGEVFKDDNKIKFIDENIESNAASLNLLDKIRVSANVDPSLLNKKTVYGFETAIGLAVQGLNLGSININLLPLDYVKERQVSERKMLVSVVIILMFLGLLSQGIKDYMLSRTLSHGVDTVNTTLSEVKSLDRIYKGVEKKVRKEEKKLKTWESIGIQGRFWIEAIHKIMDIIPENVYLSSIESLWDIPHAEKKERAVSKRFFERKKVNTSKKVDRSEKMLVMNIKGESYDPRVSYIEEMIERPLVNLTLFDQQVPVFREVKLVQGSVQHITSLDKKNTSEDFNEDQNGRRISFEIECIVNPVRGISITEYANSSVNPR